MDTARACVYRCVAGDTRGLSIGAWACGLDTGTLDTCGRNCDDVSFIGDRFRHDPDGCHANSFVYVLAAWLSVGNEWSTLARQITKQPERKRTNSRGIHQGRDEND